MIKLLDCNLKLRSKYPDVRFLEIVSWYYISDAQAKSITQITYSG